jgi:hypothetical protein
VVIFFVRIDKGHSMIFQLIVGFVPSPPFNSVRAAGATSKWCDPL